ncbi:MAG: Hsp70 family protein [Spirochaetes bacterium]|nr:Hsp70 family protein [Spirochaetota bacterium]
MSYFCGLDFGTSNSVFAVYHPQATKNQQYQIFLEPSLLFFPDHDYNIVYHIGNEARDEYLKQNMQGRFIKSIKSILPRTSFSYTMINNKPFRAEDLVELIMSRLKKAAEDQLQQEIANITLGRPIFFSEVEEEDQIAEDRLIKAAKTAGFKNINLQYEPIAAAYEYINSSKKEQNILVGDIGGGTSDFTIINMSREDLHSDNLKSKIKAVDGVHVGGDDFDAAIMWNHLTPYFGKNTQYHSWDKVLDFPAYLVSDICYWDKIPFLKTIKTLEDLKYILNGSTNKKAVNNLIRLIKYNLSYSLFQSIIQAKHDLSEQDKTQIIYLEKGIDIDTEILKISFDEYIAKNIDAIKNSLKNLLKSAELRANQIDKVLLTGGSTYVEKVKTLFEEMFLPEKIEQRHAFETVAKGLAITEQINNHQKKAS